SNRSYLRLTNPDTGKSAVFMDAPPEKETVLPFIHIAQHLNNIGLSAPEIIAKNISAGFLLIEDFGDDLFAKLMDATPQKQIELYSAAAELLVHLQATTPPDNLLKYCPVTMAKYAAPAFDQYQLAVLGRQLSTKDTILALLETALRDVSPQPTVLSLRDFHAENLLWLPNRLGVKRVGLLDFQDAVVAHPAYDLVSLLEDARRDVPNNIRQTIIRYYIELSGINHDAFYAAYSAQGAQRTNVDRRQRPAVQRTRRNTHQHHPPGHPAATG
ncbi:TPA: hypothetical protein EYP38_04545, partial [Candidatus Micrarchaeota archaeon]|nr:hypothetical protein [Candidatus Micrarchaeota archaeon]